MTTASGGIRALFVSAFAASLVAACGGGDSPSPAPVPAPTPTPVPTPPPPPAGSPTPDTTAPTAGILAPADLATGLTGTVAITGTAIDDVGVASMEFRVDGVTVGTDASSPFSVTIDANAYAPGQHIIRARASDAASNVSDWKTITVRTAGTGSVDQGFTKDESWASGFGSAAAFAQAPDGRFFVAEQSGKLRVIKNGSLLTTPFQTFVVDSAGERGLLGVAFHPNFASNGYVYVYYTVPSATMGGVSHNRISRIVASAPGSDVSDGSEVIIADLPALSLSATNHNGGALHFGTDGKLYAGVGDNASGTKAQDLNDPLGKLLRFNDDGSIPADNPFCALAAVKCAVWAYGLRNPFTFAVEPGTGKIHINDVGQNTWEEVNVAGKGLNYGWPSSEGPDGLTAGYTAPLFSYKHSAATPEGSGPGGFFTGLAIAGGAFYPSSGAFPTPYRGNYFFADYLGKWIARLDPANGNAAYAFANIAGRPVDMLVGLDGALYVLAREGSITRISSP